MKTDFIERINGLSVPDALMAYLGEGHSVFPAHPGPEKLLAKTPLVKWTPFQQRPPTMDEGRAWLERWPDLKALGFVTGSVSGFYPRMNSRSVRKHGRRRCRNRSTDLRHY